MINPKKGKTWDELYGTDRANVMRENLRQKSRIGQHGQKVAESRRGLSYDEIYGETRSPSERLKRSEGNIRFGPRPWADISPYRIQKGQTYNDFYGDDRAIQERLKRSLGHLARGSQSRYYSTQYQEWRLQVLVRDDFKCCDCQSQSSSNHVHHRIPWEQGRTTNLNLQNGETLCLKCHNLRRVRLFGRLWHGSERANSLQNLLSREEANG